MKGLKGTTTSLCIGPKMKILILANNDVGLYKFRRELLETLLKEHEVHISIPDGSFVDRLIKMGCIYHKTNFNRKGTNPIKDLELLSFYRKLIKSIKPDVVFTYTIKPNVYGGMACKMEKVPYLVNITGLGAALENKGPLQPITTMLYRLGIDKAERVFFQNKANRDFMLERHLVKDNYELIPGSGVNPEQYELLPFPNDDSIEFVYIGRLITLKGIGHYLTAAKAIKAKYPNTTFHICGMDEDGYLDEVKQLEQEGIVKYHGLVDDMLAIYKRIQCTIHPSFYPEGMSNALLESCACGRVIITTDRPGCGEIVDDGVNGFIVKQNDSDDLIEKIEKYLRLPYETRREMGINGRNKVAKEFSRQIIIDRYLKALGEINERKQAN